MKLGAISLAVLALGALVAPVYADDVTEIVVTAPGKPGAEVRSKTVGYGDLDLSKSTGVTGLLTRIKGAAKEVCTPGSQSSNLADSADYKKCMTNAVNGAVAKVNNPALTSMVASAPH